MKSKIAFFVVATFVVTSALANAAPLLIENFDDVSSLSAAGWVIANNSSPAGTTDWFQGNDGVFSAYNGADNSYIAANFEAADLGGNISSWLISPELMLNNGDTLSFVTRSSQFFPDRLEVRLSTSGSSTDVGATDASVGDFANLWLTINPGLAPTGYPDTWTAYSVVFAGLSGPTASRFAFRYQVSDTSVNADYIGIDNVVVDSPGPTTHVPEPSTLVLLSLGLLAPFGGARAARGRR